jgi:hypothetical protein
VFVASLGLERAGYPRSVPKGHQPIKPGEHSVVGQSQVNSSGWNQCWALVPSQSTLLAWHTRLPSSSFRSGKGQNRQRGV